MVGDLAESLEEACSEAKGTLDHQMNWMQQIDSKAVRILRANLVLLGLVVTAFSISTRTNAVTPTQFVNLYTIFGFLSLVTATVSAGVTYLSSSFEAGIGSGDIDEVLENDYSVEDLYRELAAGYATWIEFNEYVLRFNAVLITVTVIAVINAITLLTAGAIVGILNQAFSRTSSTLFVFLIALLLILDAVIFKSEDFVIWYYKTRDRGG